MNKLIKLSDTHYIIVDDKPYHKNDLVINLHIANINYRRIILSPIPSNLADKNWYRVIHSTKPLEDGEPMESESSFNKGHDKIKPLKLSDVHELLGMVNMEVKALKQLSKTNELFKQSGRPDLQSNLDYENGYLDGSVFGYNNALQNNSEKKYTEKDLRRAIDRAYCIGYSDKKINEHCHLGIKREEEIIQSLQPKTEWEVKILDNGKIELI